MNVIEKVIYDKKLICHCYHPVTKKKKTHQKTKTKKTHQKQKTNFSMYILVILIASHCQRYSFKRIPKLC